MKRPAVLRLWAVLCTLVILSACQKETSQTNQKDVSSFEGTVIHALGAVPDDPAKVAKLPIIVSADYLAAKKTNSQTQELLGAKGKPVRPTTTSTDVTPPTVTITSPSSGSTVSGTVSITVSATDNIAVSSVNLSVDGNLLSSSSSAPYTFSWNTSSISDGSHTLSAKATDAAGNSNTSSITVSKNTTITVVQPPTTTPSSFSLTMPPVGYQGSEFSCAVFSTVYAARSVEQYYKTNATSYSYSTNIFSPEFVYNQTKFGDCGAGTGVTTALDFMKNTGVCTWQSMPYSYTNGCSLMPTNSQTSEASNYKISSYSWLYASDQTAIKTMLLNKHTIITTVNPDQSFYDAKAGFVWTAYTGAKSAGHALVICGYDDAKHAYKIMNSWGTSWGDSGFSWIDYDFFPYTGGGICYVITSL